MGVIVEQTSDDAPMTEDDFSDVTLRMVLAMQQLDVFAHRSLVLLSDRARSYLASVVSIDNEASFRGWCRGLAPHLSAFLLTIPEITKTLDELDIEIRRDEFVATHELVNLFRSTAVYLFRVRNFVDLANYAMSLSAEEVAASVEDVGVDALQSRITAMADELELRIDTRSITRQFVAKAKALSADYGALLEPAGDNMKLYVHTLPTDMHAPLQQLVQPLTDSRLSMLNAVALFDEFLASRSQRPDGGSALTREDSDALRGLDGCASSFGHSRVLVAKHLLHAISRLEQAAASDERPPQENESQLIKLEFLNVVHASTVEMAREFNEVSARLVSLADEVDLAVEAHQPETT
jgi:hypothetical protein